MAQSGHPARSDPRPLSGEQRTATPARFPWNVVLRGSARQQPTQYAKLLRVMTLPSMSMWPMLLNNSLIQLISSLFLENLSLLICLGNCARSHCSAAVSSHEIGSGSLKIAKFPVKFPVSREFAWRRVRSALRRQPASPRFREFPSLDEKRPLNAGFSHRH